MLTLTPEPHRRAVLKGRRATTLGLKPRAETVVGR